MVNGIINSSIHFFKPKFLNFKKNKLRTKKMKKATTAHIALALAKIEKQIIKV